MLFCYTFTGVCVFRTSCLVDVPSIKLKLGMKNTWLLSTAWTSLVVPKGQDATSLHVSICDVSLQLYC